MSLGSVPSKGLAPAHPVLHNNTCNHNNLPPSRKRLVLDFVDPYGGSIANPTIAKSHKQIHHFTQGHRAYITREQPALRGEYASYKKLESWECLSPAQAHFDSMPSNVQRLATLTPKDKRRGARKPLHAIVLKSPSPLPPSTPPGSSPQDKFDIELLGVEVERDNADPFGFLAAERRLKARRPDLPSPKSKDALSLNEDGYSEAGSSIEEAFASKAGRKIRRGDSDELSSYVSLGKRPAPSSLSEISVHGRSEVSSPCQQASRRKSETQEKKRGQRPKRGKLAKAVDDDLKNITLELEALLPKRSGNSTRQRNRARKACKAMDGKKRGRRYKRTMQGGQKVELYDLDNEARERLEREREERMRHYMYKIPQEKVWII